MDSDALSAPFLTNASPEANAPAIAASPAAANVMTAWSRSAIARRSSSPAAASSSSPVPACAVSIPGAVSTSRRYEAWASAAGIVT
jgi:hypothetical protein